MSSATSGVPFPGVLASWCRIPLAVSHIFALLSQEPDCPQAMVVGSLRLRSYYPRKPFASRLRTLRAPTAGDRLGQETITYSLNNNKSACLWITMNNQDDNQQQWHHNDYCLFGRGRFNSWHKYSSSNEIGIRLSDFCRSCCWQIDARLWRHLSSKGGVHRQSVVPVCSPCPH